MILRILFTFLFVLPAFAVDRPNVLWITAEDMSATLGCYGDDWAITPNIDALAKQSVKYTHAFASAPVCSPSRACLINGMLATSQGAHQMRSAYPLPAYMKGFPAKMRKEGYYTSNNVKTDYNSAHAEAITEASWNESSDRAHWRKRGGDRPFFSIFNLMTSHQSRSMVWPYEKFTAEVQSKLKPEQIHDPEKAKVPPYWPDTPITRREWARLYDCVTAMDTEVGALLKQLDEDGLADDTIVFFYADHGTGMPRHKRVLYDSGMHVPLLIRFPEKYRHLAPVNAGESTDRLVSFEDFGPTVLSLTGVEIPKYMQGRPFLGPKAVEPREYIYGHRDRVDEALDVTRSVRDKRYLYIRNYMPHIGWNQQTAWPDQGDLRKEFYTMIASGKMTPAQAQFSGPTRPREELYDCESDPINLSNLVDSEAHKETLNRLRAAHRAWVRKSRDLGFLPEIEMAKLAEKTTPYQYGHSKDYKLAELMKAASVVGSQRHKVFHEFLGHADPGVRYWAAVACSAAPGLPKKSKELLEQAVKDDSAAVRIAAAEALCRHGATGKGLPVLRELLKSEDTTVLLHAARAVEMLGEKAKAARGDMQALFNRFEEAEGDPAMFIRFTAQGYLDRVK